MRKTNLGGWVCSAKQSIVKLRAILIQTFLAFGLVFGIYAGHQAQAFGPGLIVLEGSDAQTYHSLEPYSTNFLTGLQIYSSAPGLPVLAIGYNPIGTNPAGKVFASSLLGISASDLLGYSGLYIGSPYSCCSENDAVVAGHEGDILAFHAAGRSVAVENYTGGAAFSFLTGFTLTGSQAIGYDTPGGGEGCFDGNVITAAGGVFGLGAAASTLPSIHCFGHQAYLSSFMVANGFGFNLADNPAFPGYTVVASNGGGGVSAGLVPEPETYAMLLAGLGLLGFVARRRKQKLAAA